MQLHDQGSAPQLGEGVGVLQEQIHHRYAARGTLGDRHLRLESCPLESGQRPVHLIGREVHHQIHVAGRTKVPVQDHRQPTDPDVTPTALVQLAEQRL